MSGLAIAANCKFLLLSVRLRLHRSLFVPVWAHISLEKDTQKNGFTISGRLTEGEKMGKLLHFPDGTIKTDKGVPIIITDINEYQDEEDENDARSR